MDFEQVVDILEKLDPEEYENTLFLDLLGNNLSRGSAKSFLIYNNDTAPDWIRAYANSTNEKFGRHVAIMSFFAEKGDQNASNQVNASLPAVSS